MTDQLMEAAHSLPEAIPYFILGLAAIGLATVAYLLWVGLAAFWTSVVQPVFSYFGSGPRQLMSFWLYALAVFGGASLGYGVNEQRGMWVGMGVVSLILGGLTTLIYWFRLWVKWSYNEKDG